MSVNTKVNGELVPSAGLYKVSVPIQSGDIYSFEERQIGVYTDGKPLYQKTVDFGALPNNTTKQVAHNVANLDKIAYVNGIINYSGLIYGEDMPPVILSKSFRTAVRENVVEISTTDNLSSYGAIVTFKYTKTTDVAGSGKYVPSGDKAVHYDNTEQVIGTWFGETLYRKSFDIGNLLNNGTKTVAHGISNLKYVVNWSGTCYSTEEAGYCRPIPLADPTATNTIRLDIGDGNINIKTASNWSAYKAFVTLEYTKTS